ncbi:hypothetical protein K469DRAFT_696379 [Zopfia rhizophila CBS 207.26]|uniref:Uncharacterized protein n=1 Tax=Zopfia rhizophila CBS 207.26 TaxID=1314779 RepID=A0A6A6DH34_9PEZI|nr:hypothetical protein K469DRAFT_696379 [Zopfia rhizophila CBS 207.26]
MSSVPSPVLTELCQHLDKVWLDPTTTLDEQLLEKCELYTTTPEYLSQQWKPWRPLFTQIAMVLTKLQQDPSPLIHFALKLTAPYHFEDVKGAEFEMGLGLAAKPFHPLILSLLEKASANGSDAQTLANRPTVIQAVVRLWLCTDDTGIATKAGDLLVSLLRVSKSEPDSVDPPGVGIYGRGPIWKRLFEDKDVYHLFYLFCSLKDLPSGSETPLSKRDKTIAQARLLEWLPKVGAIDWDSVTASHHPEVEQQVGLNAGEGLLDFAAKHMVDTADDLLMHMSLINFFSDLISTVRTHPPLSSGDSSLSLEFLKQQGIHKQIIDFHTTDIPGVEHSFLSSRTANYISVYASTYPDYFESSPEVKVIQQQLERSIRKCEHDDLHILASMPRTSLVPRTSAGLAWDECLLLGIPITRTNSDALKTLATVFHGPLQEEITFPPPATTSEHPSRHATEQIYARLLTSLYYTRNTSLFTDIIRHADTIAMKDNALAALILVRALITANWSTASSSDADPILLRLQEFPKTGLDLILDPTISGGVLPYLLKPATTFSNLVGGRGDAENAAYQVAMAKFDVLKCLGERLEKAGGRQDVVGIVRRRVAEGPWGVGGAAGSRIGTLEL